VPTEIDIANSPTNPDAWIPTGDDNRGSGVWLWTTQKYDWMNRGVRKINTDGIDQTTLNDSDILISYAGCGCAGGVETTIQGELVPNTDPGGSGNARRKQKSYTDILGRTEKVETFMFDGTTVYSTVVNEFNGRDQIISSTQYAGTTTGTSQETTASFDGYGRLSSSHKPEQLDGSTPKYTTYTYNPDDSFSTMTDARGAVTAYTYDVRGLTTNLAWTVPNSSGIFDPADVTFAYDNVGNRTAMTDGAGNTAYVYDSLSQLTSETRQFSDTLVDAPLSSSRFQLSYTYAISGNLKSYTDPYGKEISYGLDRVGRTTSVTGTSFAGVTSYASNPSFRAWGGVKHFEFGNGFNLDQTYDNRLKSATFTVDNPSDSENAVFDKTYQYYADGRLKKVDENDNLFSTTWNGETITSAMYDRLLRMTTSAA
jgi:YD repeat-containing protein